MSFFEQEASRKAAKAAADALWAQKNGVAAYSLGGKIIVGCGIGWALLSIIPILCKTPISECLWMLILAGVQIIAGVILIALSKKSKRFQDWAEKDFKKDLRKKEKLETKVKIGKVTLPMTYGDILALKILGVATVILLVIIGIGLIQGWVEW